MSEIIRYDNYCHISQEEDLKLFKELEKQLSYKVEGSEFSKLVKNHLWDGKKHLLSSSGKFPAGLYEKVINFYNEYNIYPDIVDERIPITPNNPKDISEILQQIKKVPRYYQVEAVEAALSAPDGRSLIKIATGGGKTLCIALLVAKVGKKSIVYVVGKDLLHQIYNLFVSIFGADCVGRIGDGICDIKDINIATVWSIGAALGKPEKSDEDEVDEEDIDFSKKEIILRLLKETKLHIFDEAHQSSCNTIQLISKNIFPEYVHGFSATPQKNSPEDLLIQAIFGKIVYNLSAKRLIEEGFLVPPDIRFYALDKYSKKKELYPTVYSDYIVNNEQRNKLIIKANKTLIEQGFKPLTLFKTIKHGKILFDLAKDLNLGFLSGVDSTKKRQKVQDLFLEGKINGIIASTIFDCGIDMPSISGLIVGSAGKSTIRCLQRVGRTLRLSPGKTKSAVIDFIDSAPYLYSHSQKRRQILSTEFNVKWPA